MRLKDAWRLSRVPYLEVAFRSAQMNRMGSQTGSNSSPEKRVKSIIRSTRISKIVFTLFIGLGSGFPFLQYAPAGQHTSLVLVSAISLSLLISLGYLVLYLFQILPSFASTEPYALLVTLPFAPGDFTLVSFLSFLRMFDTQAALAIAVQTVAVGLLTLSLPATLLMLVLSSVNIVFGISIAVILSRVFYENMMRGGRSITGSISRIAFLLTWGIATMSFGFFFDFVPYITKYISAALESNLSDLSGAFFSLVHPFSTALVIASAVYPRLYAPSGSTFEYFAYGASVFYVALGVYAARRTLRVVALVAQGRGTSVARRVVTEFKLKTASPLFAYFLKDLRTASKSPATAFLFAFPIFETLIVYFSVSSIQRFSATATFTSMSVGLFFIMFMSSILLNTEASAIDYTLTLPLRPSTIVNAKALLVTLAYTPVPIAMLLLELHKSLASPYLMLVPFIEILAVASAGAAQISIFIVGHKKVPGENGKLRSVAVFEPSGFSMIGGRDVVRLAISVAVGVGLLAVPIIAYVVSFFLLDSHFTSIVLMALAGIVELLGVEYIISR